MSEMLEKAARALHASVSPTGVWERLPEGTRKGYARHARAVLQAIREPNDAMQLAGYDYAPNQREKFAAMIDEVLK